MRIWFRCVRSISDLCYIATGNCMRAAESCSSKEDVYFIYLSGDEGARMPMCYEHVSMRRYEWFTMFVFGPRGGPGIP